MSLPRFSVIAHSDFWTIRENVSGDIMTLSLWEQGKAREICELLNRAFNSGRWYEKHHGGEDE